MVGLQSGIKSANKLEIIKIIMTKLFRITNMQII